MSRWKIRYFDDTLQDTILQLPASLLARFLRYTDRMELFGPDLGMPHTRAMGQGLFELRLKGPDGIGRVFYGTVAGREIIFLHAFIKKTQKTPPKELALARKRLKAIKPC